MSTESPNLPIYKVIISGDSNVGKTSLIRRYCEGQFDESRITTLGVDFQTKLVMVGDTQVKLSIWDVAGQEKFQTFRDTFYRGAHAVALVYDVTQPPTFFSLMHWREEIHKLVPLVPMAVIGNKNDLYKFVAPEEARAWARSLEMPFLLTSAATGEGVEALFSGLAYLAVKEQKRREESEASVRERRPHSP